MAILAVVAILVVGVGSCGYTLAAAVQLEGKLQRDLGDRASSVTFALYFGSGGSQASWTIRIAPGYESQATDMACNVVRPDMQGTLFASSPFVLVDRYGLARASNLTRCT